MNVSDFKMHIGSKYFQNATFGNRAVVAAKPHVLPAHKVPQPDASRAPAPPGSPAPPPR